MNMNERTIQNGVCRVQMTGICKSFGGINALNDVSLELRAGEILNNYLQRPFALPETAEVGVGDNYYLGVYCVVFPS